tara:strand:+ start:52992 stop:53633 length:642 start_codon:yes stop_codon:yes gene_type:complete
VIELASLNGSNGFEVYGVIHDNENLDGASGNSVSSAGDVNGDGIDDLIIGAIGGDPNGSIKFGNAGESYVVYGGADLGSSGVFGLGSLNGSNGFVLNGIDSGSLFRPGDSSGYSVSSAGDMNDDGIDDLIIGALRADPNGNADAGESYVVFGRDPSAGCLADLTADGLLDFFDVSAFLDAFGIEDPTADFTNDGLFDFFDVSAFLDAFGSGCP